MSDATTDLDPRGAPVQAGLAPIVIEKHRVSLDGEERTSFYACGVTRSSREEAMADARQLADNAYVAGLEADLALYRTFVRELVSEGGPLRVVWMGAATGFASTRLSDGSWRERALSLPGIKDDERARKALEGRP